MLYRQLGKSDLNISAISFGAWQIGDPDFWGTETEANPEDTVAAAIDAGINFFDTAEVYGDGNSEVILGKALQEKRDKVYIASKVSTDHCTPEGVRKACESSLQRLGTSWIDLYQIHWPFNNFCYHDVYMELEKLKNEGKIRHVGLSNFGSRDIGEWMGEGVAVSNQLGYNLLFRAPEYDMIPTCRNCNLGVITYMPLMQGLLTGQYDSVEKIPMPRRRTRHFDGKREGARHGQAGHEEVLMDTVEDLFDFSDAIGIPMSVLCLCWIMVQPGITSVILGSRNVEQLLLNLQAADLNIGPAAIAQLNEFTFPLKVAMGENCDMWESEKNSRIH
ncbi:MAG: aldo/keto reductase [Candidatus Hydrogenedentes bacterium]|nr:aldo/keto reductase [Candidatus Hydrogenedentota bacterium]